MKRPDFIIAGAMKSGTTTIHHVLDQLSSVYIPGDEVNYLSDHCLKHGGYRADVTGDLRCYKETVSATDADYLKFFEEASSGQLIGEDSTHYLWSEDAFRALRALENPPKLIFILRDPTSRYISQYWHDVGAGRVTLSPARAIASGNTLALDNSIYGEHLERYLNEFGQENVHIITLEEYLKNSEVVIKNLLDFLGIENQEKKASVLAKHENKGSFPKSLCFRLWRNHICGSYLGQKRHSLLGKVIWKLDRIFNTTNKKPLDYFSKEERAILDQYFIKNDSKIKSILRPDQIEGWYKAL